MGTLKDIYEIIKELKEVAKNYQNSEMTALVITMQEKFFDVKEEMEDLKDRKKELETTIKQLENSSDLEKDLELQTAGYYIRISEKEKGKNISYCAACWQNLHKLMPFIRYMDTIGKCSNCNSIVPGTHGKI